MKRALIVEDAIPLQDAWRRVLSRMCEEAVVDVAGDVESALCYLKQNDYRVVVCDYQLPDGTGGDVLNWVQKNRSHLIERHSFFFCTGAPWLARRHEGIQLINKPFSPGDLAEVSSLLI